MNTYEVTISVDGMEYADIGTVIIEAESEKEAKEWVTENIRLSTKIT